ncbi:MAG: FkbM family methyltransferase [Fibrobacteres bacterium]|nr:FkbM family methyltransferase [Fibrobacterota bacterium]
MKSAIPNVRQILSLHATDLCRAREALEAPSGALLAGAGQYARGVAQYLATRGPGARAVADNSPLRHGTRLLDAPIVPFEQLPESVHPVLVAARRVFPALRDQLAALGRSALPFDAGFVALESERILALADRLDDDRSREVLDAVVLAMVTGREEVCAQVCDDPQYFCLSRFRNGFQESFVDAGAYVGDTIERFLWAQNGSFRNILAFEPGPVQHAALLRRLERLRSEWALPDESVEVRLGALGERDGSLGAGFSSGPLQSLAADSIGEGSVRCWSLDSIETRSPATFLKADVEGMELEVLAGAARTIARHAPKLAVCVYHKPQHLVEVAEAILRIRPDYHLALRQHAPLLMETVLYAWIET